MTYAFRDGAPVTRKNYLKPDEDSLLVYLAQRRETAALNLEVLLAHKADLRAYEERRIAWLRTDIADCEKAIRALSVRVH